MKTDLSWKSAGPTLDPKTEAEAGTGGSWGTAPLPAPPRAGVKS